MTGSQELQARIRHLRNEGPTPGPLEGPCLSPRAKHPAAPTCHRHRRPQRPPLSAWAARRRAGGDFKCSHPSRGTSPAHVTAAWRRPCPPRRTPRCCRRGRPAAAPRRLGHCHSPLTREPGTEPVL